MVDSRRGQASVLVAFVGLGAAACVILAGAITLAVTL